MTSLSRCSSSNSTHDTSRTSFHIKDLATLATTLEEVTDLHDHYVIRADMSRLWKVHFPTEAAHAMQKSTPAWYDGRKTKLFNQNLIVCTMSLRTSTDSQSKIGLSLQSIHIASSWGKLSTSSKNLMQETTCSSSTMQAMVPSTTIGNPCGAVHKI